MAPYRSRAAKRGCFKRGGFPIWTCPSFFVLLALSRFFGDFPYLLRDGLGTFPIRPFFLSRSIKITYEEQSPKGPRHNLDLSPKKWETPGFGNPPGLASLNCAIPRDYLSDTPLLHAMGFLVSQHGQLGAIPPPPFLSISPLESIREVEVRYPPPSKGVSQQYLRDTTL